MPIKEDDIKEFTPRRVFVDNEGNESIPEYAIKNHHFVAYVYKNPYYAEEGWGGKEWTMDPYISGEPTGNARTHSTFEEAKEDALSFVKSRKFLYRVRKF